MILIFFIKKIQIGMNFEAVRSESSIIHAFPFNSEKKRGGVAVKRVIFIGIFIKDFKWFT